MPDLRSRDTQVDLDLVVGENGVGSIELRPKRGASLPLHLATLLHLDDLLGEIERLAATDALKLVILRAAEPRPTLPGYDLDEIRALRDEWIVAWSREGQRVLRRLELLPVPSFAAIQEPWLGGAAELALACSYRIAADTANATIGFPQTRLGFLPAWGGTVRLPRLVGLRRALDLILTGRTLHGDEALKIGLIDRLVTGDDDDGWLEKIALERATQGRASHARRKIRHRLLDETAPGRRLVVARAGRQYLGSPVSNLAGRVALELVKETVGATLEEAFARESAAAGELIVGTDAQGRIHSERLTDRAARRTPIGVGEFQAVAILGAGETGADLAHLLLSAGIPVRIKDVSPPRVRAAVGRVQERVLWERQHGRISEQQARRRSARAKGATGYGGFGTLDLVIVASDGTDPPLQDQLADVESHVRATCLVGFHDWIASPSRAQLALEHPERLIGLLPSLPPDRFPLLEIVPGTLTSPEALASIRRLARRLGLAGLIVSDVTPTPGTRLLGTFLAETGRLLAAGVSVTAIDEACIDFGFELGPLQRIDAIGAGRVIRMLQSLASAVGDRMMPAGPLLAASRAGSPFYHYRSGRPTGPNPDLEFPVATEDEAIPPERIRERLVLALINEAAGIIEEGGVGDPGDLEIISIYGLGFPRERGGILFHAQEVGLATVVAKLTEYARDHGERFAPAGLLRDLALSGGSFFAGGSGAGHSAAPVVE